jgi:hypothetical protein
LTTSAAVFDDSFDCIVGLAYPSMAAKFASGEEHVPVFDSIIDKELLDRNMFAFYLSKDSNGSSLQFGAIHP